MRIDPSFANRSQYIRTADGCVANTVVAVIGPATAASAQEFGLRVDVQPETAAVGPLVDALAAFAEARRAEAEGEGEK